LIPARQISGCRQIVGSAVVASLKGLIVRPIARPTRISPLHTWVIIFFTPHVRCVC
jgi:hypothetical protein